MGIPVKIAIHRAPRAFFFFLLASLRQKEVLAEEREKGIYKQPRDLLSVHVRKSVKLDSLKWRIQRRGPGRSLFLDQTEARRAENIFLGETAPPLLSRSESGTALFDMYRAKIATLNYKIFNLITPTYLEHVIVGRGERTSTTCVITIA